MYAVAGSWSRTRLLLAAVFGLSGAGALVYETAWVRQLSLVFGSTTLAVTTIVTVFMAGLALGAAVAGPRADRARCPGRIYAALECAIAACALALPTALEAFASVWHHMVPNEGLPVVVTLLLRFAAGSGLLLVPTALMGATLPFLARQFVVAETRIGPDLGWLYGLNTLGGALGAWIAGTRLLSVIGTTATTRVGVGLSLLAALVAWIASRPTAGDPAADPGSSQATAPDRVHREPATGARAPTLPGHILLPVAFGSGLTFLAAEVLWVRLLRLYLPLTPLDVFSLVLTACLVGLGGGSLVYTRLQHRLTDLRHVGLLLSVAGPLAALPAVMFVLLPGDAWLGPALGAAVLLFAAASLCWGMLFPLYNRLGAPTVGALGRTVGGVYAAITIGNIAGSFLAGFVLIPSLGLSRGLLVCGALDLLLAAIVAHHSHHRRLRRVAVGAGIAVVASALLLPARPWLRLPQPRQLVFYADGLNATTAVSTLPDGGDPQLMVESIYSHIRADDIRPDIPLLLHPDPRAVLLVGFASGSNAWRAVATAADATVTAVELDDNQRRTARFFAADNHDVMDEPRFRFVADDGRSYLHGHDGGFDVIIMDAYLFYSHLDLYALGFTRLARSRLAPGGIYCQRLPTRNLQEPDLAALVATFLAVFPDATLWHIEGDIYTLIGFTGGLDIDGAGLERRVADLARRAPPGVHRESTGRLLSRLVAGPEQLAALAEGAAPITEDRPYRLISAEHPAGAEVFNPLFPDRPGAPPVDLPTWLRRHRPDPTRYVHGLSPSSRDEARRPPWRSASPGSAPPAGPAGPTVGDPTPPRGPVSPTGR